MNFDLRFYWALFLRRLPVMLLLLLVCSGFGVATAVNLPNTYRTSARLLVEAPQIPDSMVASTVRTDAGEQLDIVEQKLLTRANMLEIAHRFNVMENVDRMSPDKVMDAMKRATRIRRSSGRDKATLMTISFEARTPKIAADVVNEYVTLVLEENVDFRMSRTENTLSFFKREVQQLEDELNRQSVAIAKFKSDNADALPEDQTYRLGRQNLLQDRLARLERDIKSNIDQREETIQVFEATGRIRETRQPRRRSPEEEQLRSARLELEKIRAVYAASSPRVLHQQAIVDRLEATVAGQTTGSEDGDADPEEAFLKAALVEIDSRIASLQTEIEATKTELDDLQRTISSSAANGIALAALQREYNIIQSRYNAAVDNLNEAQMSERVETEAQGQRISVIENANVPRQPSGPDRPKIAITGALLGGGLAAAYFLLMELLNRKIRRPAEMIGHFNVTPITTIPYIESPNQRLLRRTGMVATTLIVLIGVPLGLWYIDTHYLPLEQIVRKGLGTLGIG